MRPRALILALEGPSGSGKTTIARAAAERFGWTFLPEAYDRLRRRPSLAFRSDRALLAIERRLLAEERRRFAEARSLRARGRTVVADTGFLGPLTYSAGLVATGAASPGPWRALRTSIGPGRKRAPLGLPDLTVYLDLPRAARRARVARDPTGHPPSLARRHESIGEFERRFYREDYAVLLPGRLCFVPASGPPSAVADRILRSVGATRPMGGTGPQYRPLVDRLDARVSGADPGATSAWTRRAAVPEEGHQRRETPAAR